MRTVGAYARLLASTLLAFTAGSPLAQAQGALGASGFSPVRATHSVAPFEHVDPFSGNLLLTFTDLELPGNAGLDLRVQRVYNSKIHRDYHDTPNHFKQRTWVGLGWSLHFGRVLHADAASVGEMVIEMSDGSGHPLFNALANDPDNTFGAAVTAELWRYDRTSRTLRLPNGLTYVFGQVGIGGGPDGQVRYVTSITDPYGNQLFFDYFTGAGGAYPGPTDGVRRIRQGLGGGEQREITFTVTPLVHGYALATMQYGDRTWTYQQVEPPSAPTQLQLASTSGPVPGTTWTFAYRTGSPGPELLTAVGPFGGELRYSYADQDNHIYSTANFVRTRVVTTRAVGLTPTTTAGTWTFAYGTGPFENTSTVDGPIRRETYRYRGIGLDTGSGVGGFAPWIVGAMDRHTIEALGGAVLQETVHSWAPSFTLSDDNVEPPVWDDDDQGPLPYGVWGAAVVQKALLTQTSLTRGPRIWHRVLTYDQTNPLRYNDYFRPRTMVSWYHWFPSRMRVTDQTFWYGVSGTPYIRDRVGETRVSAAGQTLVSTSAFQGATGFLTSQTVRGVTTTFTRTTRGNVASVTDAASKTTTYAYSYGVPIEIDGPDAGLTVGVDLTRTVKTDGTITTERVGPLNGGLTTAFLYDALMRVIRITPPGNGAPTTVTYPSGAGGYQEVARGGTFVRTYVDGLGRASRTEDAHGVKTRQVFDAIGRVTHQYLPYKTEPGARVVRYEYDALDQPTKEVAADGVSETVYTYNGTETWITDPMGRTTVYDYFSDTGPGGGQLEKVRDAATHETVYTYDARGTCSPRRGRSAGAGAGRTTARAGSSARRTRRPAPRRTGGISSAPWRPSRPRTTRR